MHLAARTTGLEGRGCSTGSNTGNWVNLGSRGIEGARNWDSIEEEEVIGMMERISDKFVIFSSYIITGKLNESILENY